MTIYNMDCFAALAMTVFFLCDKINFIDFCAMEFAFMKKYLKAIILTLSFVLFTVAVKFIGVQPVGAEGSEIGFAALNLAVNKLFGEHSFWYLLTEAFGVLAICLMAAFALLGFVQLIKRKSFLKIDRKILVLGGPYVVLILLYVFFEKLVINYRPIVSNGVLEASYPSSHTMLILTVFGTALSLIGDYIKKPGLVKILHYVIFCIMILTIVGRLICGVHWFTDIIG